MPELRSRACPKCGQTAQREQTEVGIFLVCASCGFEAADPLDLDFKSD